MQAVTIGNRIKVMIVGAGTGGLCLAQGLKADGIAVEVFERDYSPTDRLQLVQIARPASAPADGLDGFHGIVTPN